MSNITNTTNNTDTSGIVPCADRESASVEKKPITSTLRSMSVGQSVAFPIEQRTSVLIVANRIKKELARIGWDYLAKDNEEDYTISISRIK